MPLNLFSIFFFIFMFRLPAISSGLDAKHGCLDRCGDLSIPYPFGVGPSCSLNPYFNMSCDSSSHPPKAYLSFINKRVFEINETYIRVEPLNIFSACYEDGNQIESYNHRMTLNLSGTPYTIYWYDHLLTAIGCDDGVLQTNGSSTVDGCSAFCMDKNGRGGMGHCPFEDATSPEYGCCHVKIEKDTATTAKTFIVETQLIDMSRKVGRRKLFPCSYAFIQEITEPNATEISYPLYYLDNSTALLNDNWASATRRPMVRLDWFVGDENCSLTKLNDDTYACQDEKSVCVDDVYAPTAYRCRCLVGYEGNPYLLGSCKPIEFLSSSIARPGCANQCGKLSIPFPFGVGQNCSLEPSFEIFCNTSTNPARAYLPNLKNAEIIEINSSRVLVNYPNMGFACHDNSSVYQSLVMDLSETQFTLSDENWMVAIGVDDMVVGNIRHANGSSITSFCAAVLRKNSATSIIDGNHTNYEGDCLYGDGNRRYYERTNGCCMLSIPRGSSYLEGNLIGFSGRLPLAGMNMSCSFALVRNMDWHLQYQVSYLIPNNSTEMLSDYWKSTYLNMDWLGKVSMDWRVGVANCNDSRENLACQSNTKCIDFDATVGGYLCNCLEGYQGNPYITPGCQDINECADNTTNACNSTSICINTPGSYQCSCPKGYFGDGKKDGIGCIHLPPSKSKKTILIGMCSGLGFLLFLLMCFWLYKLLQKKREKMLKEKFFKRNGGLLLRQQTNEGTLGQTKVFLAEELEVATDHFNENRILGQGGQGTVYKGMLSDGKIVAIKKSKLVDENQVEPFINEVAILSQINHRNVVRLLGCCLEIEVPLLVYEFMPNGTLYDLIHDLNNEFPFPWNMRVKIAADIAGALAYLHSASYMHIYHRDIKSSNILLDGKYVVKVSDFGTSKSISSDQTHFTTLVKGTFGYLDPEYFQSSQFTEKSDVYSFGVILAELLTGQPPISFDIMEEERGLATRFRRCMEEVCLETILDSQVSKESKQEEVILVARLAHRCLNMKGRMRPTMKEVANELESYKMSQTYNGVEDESEDAMRGYEDIFTSISDNEITWTGSNKSVVASSPDTNPLMFPKD